MNRKKLMLVMSAVAVLSAPHAFAGTTTALTSEKVRFADLNLQQPAGASALYDRLYSAAERVCAPHATLSLSMRLSYRHCVADAVKAAVIKVDQPLLTEQFRAKGRGYYRSAAAVAKS